MTDVFEEKILVRLERQDVKLQEIHDDVLLLKRDRQWVNRLFGGACAIVITYIAALFGRDVR